MSYTIFKQNMLTFMRNQPNIAFKEQFAKKITEEYDALIKRGFDTVNGIPLIEGNTGAMEQVMNGVLDTAFQQSSGEHAIITNMGKAFQAYWTPTTIAGSFIEILVDILLDLIPDDTNTVEAVTPIVKLTSSEILNDAPDPDIVIQSGGSYSGHSMDSQLTEVKKIVSRGESTPPTDINSNPEDETGETLKVVNQPIKCLNNEVLYGSDGKINYELQLSPNVKLRTVTLDCIWPHKLKNMVTANAAYKSQKGIVKIDEIVCNLKSLAVNIIEPLLKQYPGFFKINSAFRATSSAGGASQHMVGEAIDIQWKDISTEKYMEISNWVLKNLPVDQIIYEHTSTYGGIWLHISHKKNGKQRYLAMTMKGGSYIAGFKNYYPTRKKK